MSDLIDFESFDFSSYAANLIGTLSIDEIVSITSEWMTIAEKDINPKVTIRYRGFGKTKEESEKDCMKTIREYLLP